MSVHSKPRIPSHKHFRDEVVESKQVRPNRPAYRSVHWTDTVIDGVLTLDQTIVDFTRQWEAEDCVLGGGAFVYELNTASGGKCVFVPSTVGSDWVVRTPYISGSEFGGGNFYCVFRMRVGDISSGTKKMRIQVICDRGSPLAGYRDIAPNEFTANDTWQTFAIKTEVRENDTNIALLVSNLVTGLCDYVVDWVGYVSADVPLATQNTSAGDATQNTSASDATQNSSAGDATQNSSAGDATQNTSAASGYMDKGYLGGIGLSDQLEVGNTEITLQTLNCSHIDNAINLAVIKVMIYQGASGGYGDVRVTTYPSGDITLAIDQRTLYISDTLSIYEYMVLVLRDISDSTIYVRAIKDGAGTVWMRAGITAYQYKTHTHTMTNPAHSTSVTNPSHPTSLTNPSHPTSLTNPSHPTTVTNPPHEP